MKKLLLFVALSFALTGFAEDNYFYWMIADDATLPSGDPLTAGGTYYAKIKVDDASTTSYLGLYGEVPGSSSGSSWGDTLTFEAGDCQRVFAKLGSDTAISYLIELYSDSPAASEPIGYASLSYAAIQDFITQGGMGVTSPYSVQSFSAVPEPTSGMLLLLGVAGLALRRKNKKA